jgi:hypothetical protein
VVVKAHVVVGLLLASTVVTLAAQAPEWGPDRVRDCDRACLVGLMDQYLDALVARDPGRLPPRQMDVRMTENTAQIDIGEGVLWKSRLEPTTFRIDVADPVHQQVARQTRMRVQGRETLVAIRLRIDRGALLEIEHLHAGNVDPAALELLTTPRAVLLENVPPDQRVSRQTLVWAANSYFDALEGDNGKIGAFADDCVRHEQGYRTVNNPPPGGRLMPGPGLPNPATPQGQQQLQQSMLTCEAQISAGLFTFQKHIRPRRVLVVDEEKQLVATFPLFVHDGSRRGAPSDAPPAMIQNLVTMETFAIRGGLIRHVEAFPFVTVPYGWGDGWTIGSGR